MPVVVEQTGRGGTRVRNLLQAAQRTDHLSHAITDDVSSLVVAQLLFLQSESSKKPIHLYINSPGGSVTTGLGIYDTMQYVLPPVATWCVGQACSMASLLLAAGSPGMRHALPNARIMIHQPSGGVQGQATDIQIQAEEILKPDKLHIDHPDMDLFRIVCCLVLLSLFGTIDNVFGVPLRNSIWTNDTEIKSINVARLVDNLVKAVKIVEDEYGVVSVAKSPNKRWDWLSFWGLGTAQPIFHMLKRVNHSRVFREAVGVSRVGRSAQLISELMKALNLVKIKNKIETWILAKSSCVTCKIIATLLQIVVKMGTSDVEITITIYSLCILLQTKSRKICDSISATFANDVLDVLKRVEMRPSEICSFMMMDEACAESNTIHEWSVPFPPIKKPPVTSPVPPLEGAPTIKVLQLSDTHYDPDYETGGNAECNEPLCCRATNGPPATAAAAAGAWGDYRKCDTPKRTIDHMLQHIAAEHPDIDYILWTGDLPPHDVWNQTRKKNMQIIRDTVAQMIETFPGVPIFPALGNHESSPANSFPPPSTSGENKMSWLYDELHKQWARLLPSDVPATVRYGAFYSLLARPGLRIISVNTNYCNNLNFHLLVDSKDPAHELRWLIRELQLAENNGEKVHIIGHIPPGGSNCVKVWSGMYYKIINRYESTVAAQFFGHTHFDEYEVFYDTADLKRALGIAYIGPSVTSYYNLNPGYRIYHVDGDHKKTTRLVVDHESWIMNLDDANRHGHPKWYKMYSARQAYKMPSLLPKNWDALIDKMTDDQATFDLYYKHYYKDSPVRPSCGNDCRKRLLCDLRSGRSQNRRTLCKRLEARIEGPTKDSPWRQWV